MLLQEYLIFMTFLRYCVHEPEELDSMINSTHRLYLLGIEYCAQSYSGTDSQRSKFFRPVLQSRALTLHFM